jgi:hypothetical protein
MGRELQYSKKSCNTFADLVPNYNQLTNIPMLGTIGFSSVF